MGHAAIARPRLRVEIPFPTAYQAIVKDRGNRNQQQLFLCSEHIDQAREVALVVLTGVIGPASACDECQRVAEAISAAARPTAVQL